MNVEDIVIFRDKFDGYIFIDSKGRLYMYAEYNKKYVQELKIIQCFFL